MKMQDYSDMERIMSILKVDIENKEGEENLDEDALKSFATLVLDLDKKLRKQETDRDRINCVIREYLLLANAMVFDYNIPVEILTDEL